MCFEGTLVLAPELEGLWGPTCRSPAPRVGTARVTRAALLRGREKGTRPAGGRAHVQHARARRTRTGEDTLYLTHSTLYRAPDWLSVRASVVILRVPS